MIADRYYYSRLSDTEKKIYQTLYRGVVKLEKEINVPILIPEKDSVQRVFDAITADNPFLYYFNQSVMDIKTSVLGTSFLPQYFCNQDQIDTYNSRISAIVNQVMDELHLSEASDSEKVLRVHDYFCMNIQYDYEALQTSQMNRLIAAHSIIGVFAKQKAVCEGISKAFKLVLNAANVKCIVVDGYESKGQQSYNPQAWNIVKIYGMAYHKDLTWDVANTKNGLINYDHYNLTDEAIRKDHTGFSGVPECNSVVEDYFKKYKLEFSNYRRLQHFITAGLSRGQIDFYFRYTGRDRIERVMQEAIEHVAKEAPKYDMTGKIKSCMCEEQSTGRLTLVF